MRRHSRAQRIAREVQRRLGIAAPELLEGPLPAPSVLLAQVPLGRRTTIALRRVADAGSEGGTWTARRYLAIPRFGSAAMVNLLSAIDLQARVQGRRRLLPAAVPIDEAMEIVRSRLPISDEQVRAALARESPWPTVQDLAQLASAAARTGRALPFRVLEIAGTRVAVAPHQTHAARVAYAIASRAVYNRGAASTLGVTQQLCVMLSMMFAVVFVERLLGALSSFEWLDRPDGWFWFTGRPNRLLRQLRKVFSVVASLPVTQLRRALRRASTGADPPPDLVLRQICTTLPGARLVDDLVTVEGDVCAAPGLKPVESWLVQMLQRAQGPLQAAEVYRLGQLAGYPLTVVRRILRASLLVDPLPDDTYALVGT